MDETWINDRVQLIPRLKNWVNSAYPGTTIGLTEYNWGAENHINGATTQADVLGIFGREGLDLATRWTTPAASTPTYKAMKLYRNYDGNKSAFGETSVGAMPPTPTQCRLLQRSGELDGALTIIVINKTSSSSAPATINLANFPNAGVARCFQLTAANSIARLTDISISGTSFVATLPPQSVTLFVIAANRTGPIPSAPTGLTIRAI